MAASNAWLNNAEQIQTAFWQLIENFESQNQVEINIMNYKIYYRNWYSILSADSRSIEFQFYIGTWIRDTRFAILLSKNSCNKFDIVILIVFHYIGNLCSMFKWNDRVFRFNYQIANIFESVRYSKELMFEYFWWIIQHN